MNYVEFFDKSPLENVAACLTVSPERVIYIGEEKKHMNAHIARFQALLGARGQTVEMIPCVVKRKDLLGVVRALSEIVETYDNCVFDITGGDEVYNLALGMVYARYPEKGIRIRQFDLQKNRLYTRDLDEELVIEHPPCLSVEENVLIYGGKVVFGAAEEDGSYRWELTDEFLADFDRIWQRCKQGVRLWNTQIAIFESMEQLPNLAQEALAVTVTRAALEEYLSEHGARYRRVGSILRYLRECGLLTAFSDEGEFVTVSYKNAQVKRCLSKAGQALELYTFLTLRQLRGEGERSLFCDAQTGVLIDWDGVLHDEETEHVYDTENEIDVFLMRGVVPIFVSCKGGALKTQELYKLSTVARRFGGAYAKMVLVCAGLKDWEQRKPEDAGYFIQRAHDMGIKLIDRVQDKTPEEFKAEFLSKIN